MQNLLQGSICLCTNTCTVDPDQNEDSWLQWIPVKLWKPSTSELQAGRICSDIQLDFSTTLEVHLQLVPSHIYPILCHKSPQSNIKQGGISQRFSFFILTETWQR